MAELKLPVSEEEIRKLKVGDFVELTGRMITGRDAAHKWLMEDVREEVMPFMKDTVIYHCGPVIAENDPTADESDGAGGSTSADDAYLEYVFAAAGTYIIGVAKFDSLEAATMLRS